MGYCFLYKRGQGSGGGGGKLEIVLTALGSIISLADSSSRKLKGLRIFGKTIQNGTPSPETPAPLESVGDDGNVGVTVCGKNLIDFSKITTGYEINSAEGALAKNAAWYVTDLIEVVPNTRYTVSGTSSLFRVELDEEGKTSMTYSQSKATFRTGAKTKFARFNSLIDGYSTPQLEVGSTATAYEPYKEPQTLTIPTPNGLPGIPVASGGNYTDENGQIWLCDEIDGARGVRVQRVGKIDSYAGEAIGDVFLSSTGALTAGATVLYPLATPIETPLSAEELAQYAALHTNYPNTTICNDEGADMEVKYTSGG